MTQTVLLGDICDVRDGTHDSPKPKDSGHPLVTSKHIKNHKIDFSTANLISDEDFEAVNRRSKVDKHDILISMIGTVGELALIDYEPTFAIKNIGLIKTGNELLGKYLFYYLQGAKAKQYIEASLAGSTQKFIGLGQLRKFPIDLPDMETQKKIAEILGTIDEKIELNRKMNETLEQMGQALFRHYFVDNPEADDWGETRVGEIAEVTDYVANGSFASLKANVTLYDEPKYALFVRTTDFKGGFNGSLKYTDKKSYEFLKKSTLFGGEFIISNVGDTGTVFRPPVWLGKPMTLGSNAIMIKDSEYNNYLYQYFRSNEGQFAISNIVAGSAQPKFNKTEFRNLRIKRPDAASLSEFNVQFRTIEDGVFSNIAQIQTLTTLRDTLLPRLISGRLKV